MQAERIGESSRFWVGVASASHVRVGVQGGYAQLCHGKGAPLREMHGGDWLLYYSPRTDMKQGHPLQTLRLSGKWMMTTSINTPCLNRSYRSAEISVIFPVGRPRFSICCKNSISHAEDKIGGIRFAEDTLKLGATIS